MADELEIGQSDSRWLAALGELAKSSAYCYNNRILCFARWLRDSKGVKEAPDDLLPSLVEYFREFSQHTSLPALKKWISVFVSFWQATQRGNVAVLRSQLMSGATAKLENGQTSSSDASVSFQFTKRHIDAYYNCPTTFESILVKVVIILLRRFDAATAASLCWDQIIALYNKGQRQYFVMETRDSSDCDAVGACVLNQLEVRIMDRYVYCFSQSERHGRFLRRLVEVNGMIRCSRQVCGVKFVQGAGNTVAQALELRETNCGEDCWNLVTANANHKLFAQHVYKRCLTYPDSVLMSATCLEIELPLDIVPLPVLASDIPSTPSAMSIESLTASQHSRGTNTSTFSTDPISDQVVADCVVQGGDQSTLNRSQYLQPDSEKRFETTNVLNPNKSSNADEIFTVSFSSGMEDSMLFRLEASFKPRSEFTKKRTNFTATAECDENGRLNVVMSSVEPRNTVKASRHL